ncbi:NADPH nitroreductase [Micromonospora tulbaghiae]|uniref:NADPH nitroreductase n=1 Tax=Micromonospora tulbaghiae TaxID=479978 RepID=A0AAW4JIP3_9ACTN|nr:3-hydroxyacyl-CoA dehydrogenase NAD-binding domain-containing protein [Micromonospora tulbaghiae]MBO4138616.1 NADPH nitroreductase [Micromonospora tulbaghiae]
MIAVVVGLGPMGRGIAQVLAAAGHTVRVVDATAELGRAGLERIRADGATGDLGAAADVETALAGADVLIEAIVEDMAAKRDLLARVAAAGGPDLLVASNTSSLSVNEMGRAFGAPERLLGLHFFNPPTRMRLVEVIVGAATGEATVRRALALVDSLGKTAVVCRDSPNFIVNRVCRPLYYEAQLLLAQGVEAAVVDAVARGALGHPMGPLQLLDFTGLHTHLASSETALREFGDPRYRPIPQVRGLVRAGLTGKAAGRGFYDYATEPPRDANARVVRRPGPPNGPAARVVALGAPTPQRVAELARLAARQNVVLDSSDAGWAEVLTADVGWIRLHRRADDAVFAEVVEDPVAGIAVPGFVDRLLDHLGAPSVRVPALPGLVGDRLAYCLVNEAAAVVEEGTATADDVDAALRLAMNHPRGPFETLRSAGAATVYEALRSMADAFGDPRYRPAQLLRRQAIGEARAAR